MILFVFFRWDF